MRVISGLTLGRSFCLQPRNPHGVKLSYTLRNPRGCVYCLAAGIRKLRGIRE
jgi:hypothetical protein